MLNKLKLENFTVFEKIDLNFANNINIFIGENGTGKTHILKLLYSFLSVSEAKDISKMDLDLKLNKVFLPRDYALGRLVRRVNKSSSAKIQVEFSSSKMTATITSHATKEINKKQGKLLNVGKSTYIPVKEMLANAPGFRSLYSQREIHFEEVYYDIVDKAFVPLLKGPPDKIRKQLLEKLGSTISGKVIVKGEQFFLKNPSGEIEFTLLAEGVRKLALLWILIQNGCLLEGATLFWDEPEANLNPSIMPILVDILLKLSE